VSGTSESSAKGVLWAFLARSGKSKAELAKAIGVSPSYISQVFGNYANTSPPSTERLKQIASVLGASESEMWEMIRLVVLERSSPEVRGLFVRLEHMLAESRSETGFHLPLLCEVPCDRFIWVETQEPYPEYVDLAPDEYVENGFVIRARGDSMAKVVLDGDLLVFDAGRAPVNGDIVCAQLSGDSEGSTIKYYFRRGQAVELRPENSEYPSLILVRKANGTFLYEDKTVQLNTKGVLKTLKRAY